MEAEGEEQGAMTRFQAVFANLGKLAVFGHWCLHSSTKDSIATSEESLDEGAVMTEQIIKSV